MFNLSTRVRRQYLDALFLRRAFSQTVQRGVITQNRYENVTILRLKLRPTRVFLSIVIPQNTFTQTKYDSATLLRLEPHLSLSNVTPSNLVQVMTPLPWDYTQIILSKVTPHCVITSNGNKKILEQLIVAVHDVYCAKIDPTQPI